MKESQKLSLIKKENEYRISSYIKTLSLVKLDAEPPLSMYDKIIKKLKLTRFFDHNIYSYLSTRQKRVLHTIAPLWANILEHNLDGRIIIKDDKGNRYDLNSMHPNQCLVGEAYDFKFGGSCSICYSFNISFAGLNDRESRNCSFLGFDIKLKNFLDHYYENHMKNYYEDCLEEKN